jgi:5,10-methylenetetrahydrofolate reductase
VSSLVERYRACPCSVELWPARTSEQARRLDETVEVLRDLAPAFVSVTYGAFGSSRAESLELVELARRRTSLEVAVALHPQGHPDSVSLEEDLDHQATKLAASDFGVTQFFFELAAYESLVAALARRGARRPVIPGLLVPRSLRQLERMGEMARVRPSERLVRVLSDGDGAGAREVILELALGALREGAPGVHLFSMNQPGVTAWLLEQLAAHYPRGSSFTQSSCDGKSAVTTTPARGSPVLPD